MRHASMSLAENLEVIFLSSVLFSRVFVLFYPRCLDSGSWTAKGCWVWVQSCVVDLYSNKIFVSFFHKFCATIALAYLQADILQIKCFVARLLLMFFFW